ncbi:MAG: hypothetical protein M3R72_02130 [Bacteroidota bacterium]|nr:hypothetical protein [Bacteroidota bacterium]
MKVQLLLCFLLFCLPKFFFAQTSKYIHNPHDTSFRIRSGYNYGTNSIFENPNPPKSYTYDYDFGLPYVENLENGFMDSFTIANTQFRFRISPDTSENCIVEKFENGDWRKNFKTDYSAYSEDYGGFLSDVNNDGYEDFIEVYKWEEDAILFNPSTKEFDTSTLFDLNEWTLLDTLQNTFCDYKEVHDHQVSSHLYRFNGLKQKILFSVEFTTKEFSHEDLPVIIRLDLYKGNFEADKNKALISSTRIHNKRYEFNYVTYWKKRYKKLLNYH